MFSEKLLWRFVDVGFELTKTIEVLSRYQPLGIKSFAEGCATLQLFLLNTLPQHSVEKDLKKREDRFTNRNKS